jgi:hypothetical protein
VKPILTQSSENQSGTTESGSGRNLGISLLCPFPEMKDREGAYKLLKSASLRHSERQTTRAPHHASAMARQSRLGNTLVPGLGG